MNKSAVYAYSYINTDDDVGSGVNKEETVMYNTMLENHILTWIFDWNI